jgi:integrase
MLSVAVTSAAAGMQCSYMDCPRRKPLSDRYIKDILDTLRAIISVHRPSDIPKPWPTFEVVPDREKQLLGMSREIAALDKVQNRHGYRIAILILLRTGMRLNEAPSLRVSDLVDGVLYVSKALSAGEVCNKRKAGKPKTYRISPELWEILMAHVAGKNPDDYVFSINGKDPIKTARLYKVWKKACADAGVKHISLQQASRHSTATEIKIKHDKAATQEIMEQLGHANTNTGRTYIADRQGLN